jgi:MFS family permease
MVTLIGLGTIVGQLPLGLIADRFDARRLTLLCAAITAGAVLLALPLDPRGLLVWVLRVPWGAAFAGLYTLTMIQAGIRFKGSEMLHAIAAVAATYTTGGMLGPALTGAAFDLFGPSGVLATIGLLGLLVAVALAVDLRRAAPAARPG